RGRGRPRARRAGRARVPPVWRRLRARARRGCPRTSRRAARSSQLLQRRDVAGKLRGRQTGPTAPAQLTVGADDFPEPVAEQRSRAFGLAVEVDAVDVLEALGRDLSEQRAKPVVKVELVGTAQND